jgi:protein-S-isoprenylcysteine O-methyltransferase Ste14
MVSNSALTTKPRLNKYGYNSIARHIVTAILICLPLFLGAGSRNWDWAWVYTLVTLAGWIVLNIVLAHCNPEMLNARGKPVKAMGGTKPWDWLIMSLYIVLLLATPFVAGLDYRNAWSPSVSPVVKVVGLLLNIASLALLTWSMAVNRFFEGTVRIQTERDHSIITTGPYRYIRHPGYAGIILSFMAVPLSVGSMTAWIPALLGVALYVVRTALEDRTLQAELPGYAEFAQRTKYRLFPGIW